MLVSVILPYFKKKHYIKEAIKSVLSQTLRNFELLIINDEPGVQSKDILYKFTFLVAIFYFVTVRPERPFFSRIFIFCLYV